MGLTYEHFQAIIFHDFRMKLSQQVLSKSDWDDEETPREHLQSIDPIWR